jgi:hypothetical protein
MASLRSALLRNLDEGKLAGLADVLYAAAVAGDWTAAELLLRYAVGKPAAAVNPDAVDLDEFKLLAGPSFTALWLACHEAVTPANAVELFKRLSAADADAASARLVDAVEAEPERFSRDLSAERRARAGR